jgi:arylsulfatase A-like enzyme
MNRRTFLTTAAAAPFVLRRAAAQRTAPPNILFILADDLGYGDPGCYGQQKMKTPQIDHLASEGMKFTDFYAGATVCAPSRCCLMTGYHGGHGRIRGNKAAKTPEEKQNIALRPEDVTVAEVLKKVGYSTGIFGKWGLGLEGTTGVPNKKGFDEWFGYLDQTHAHEYYPDFLWENEKKYPLHHQYSDDLFTARGVDFIKRHKSDPFFLYMAFTLPHANNELFRATGNGNQVPTDAPYSKEPWTQPNKDFAAMVTRLDDGVKALLDEVHRNNLDRDTLVIFTSDNGPQKEGGNDPEFFKSSGPLRGIKRDLYDGGIREPMIARWPGRIKEGSVTHFAGAFWDFMPTAADVAHAPCPTSIDGMSFLPTLLGKPQEPHEYLYWEFHERGYSQAVRMGDWKGVRPKTKAPVELYDLKTDIGEKNNLAADHRAEVERIEAIMKKAHVENSEWPTPS